MSCGEPLSWNDVVTRLLREAKALPGWGLPVVGAAIDAADEITRLRAALAAEQEAHAQLQARCFDRGGTFDSVFSECDRLRAAPPVARGEPVAWMVDAGGDPWLFHSRADAESWQRENGGTVAPMYAAPQAVPAACPCAPGLCEYPTNNVNGCRDAVARSKGERT